MFIEILVVVILLILFIVLMIVLYYISAAYQSTTTTIIPTDFWYYSDGAFHNVTSMEITVSGTFKKQKTIDISDLEIKNLLYIPEKELVTVKVPSYLKKHRRKPCNGSLEGITHKLFRQLMTKKNKKSKRWITQLKLSTKDKSCSINKYRPTNFVL